MNDEAARPVATLVADYKEILKRVLDNRPSGTRQRLAVALAFAAGVRIHCWKQPSTTFGNCTVDVS